MKKTNNIRTGIPLDCHGQFQIIMEEVSNVEKEGIIWIWQV